MVTSAMARMYRRKGNEAFVERMVPFGISAKKLSATHEKWVVMVRPSLMRDYARSGVEPNADDAWNWSMWRCFAIVRPRDECQTTSAHPRGCMGRGHDWVPHHQAPGRW